MATKGGQKTCQECKRGTKSEDKMRIAELLAKAAENFAGVKTKAEFKPTPGGVPEAGAAREGVRGRGDQGDQSQMGRAANQKEVEITYGRLPSQQAFHDLTERFKGFSGPIGSGKSQALCQEAIRMSYMNPGRTGLIGAPTYPMLRDATQATLFEILDANEIRYEHNKAENTVVLRDTGRGSCSGRWRNSSGCAARTWHGSGWTN